MAAGPSEDSEYMDQEAAVKLMLVVLSQDAIQGFYQQVSLLTISVVCCWDNAKQLDAPMHQCQLKGLQPQTMQDMLSISELLP